MNIDFSEVYKDYQQKVWNLISKYIYKFEDRQDLFQEIFVKIFKNLKKFRGESNLSTWIFKIAVNESINFSKKKKRQLFLENLLKGAGIFRSHEEEKHVEEDIKLWEPLKVLNEKQKIILIMAEVEEINLSDIAKILNISVGTVKSNLFRAKELLKKELGKEKYKWMK